jgi:hypothetical protein
MYQKVRPYMRGDFYPLFPHDPSEKTWYGYQFHRPDLDAGVAIIFRRAESPEPAREISLFGTNGQSRYELSNHDNGTTTVVNGQTPVRMEIPEAPGTAILFYKKAN